MNFNKLLAIILVSAIALGFLSICAETIVDRDAISYWAAGQLLLHHQNPYDWTTVLRTERSAHFKDVDPLIMRNPPYALFLVLPLGFVSAPVAGAIWSLLSVVCIMISISALWKIVGDPSQPVPLLSNAFAPVLGGIAMGQSSAIMLVGLTGFLRWHRTRPFAAGASLVLAAYKPHILLVFFAVVMCWVITTGSYRILAGSAIAAVATLGAALYFDPAILTDYLPILHQAINSPTSSLSSLLRASIDPGAAWLQYVLLAVSVVWALWYFFRNRNRWQWSREGLTLIVISVWSVPYGFICDEIVVLPVIMAANLWMSRRERSLLPFILLTSTAISLMVFRVSALAAYNWTATAWLGWYLFAAIDTGTIALPGRALLSAQPSSPRF
jgi:hypothetical protein